MNLFENLQKMQESEDKEPIKCLVNDNGDYINVYKRKSTGKIMAQGNMPGASFNGPWTDEHEKYYIPICHSAHADSLWRHESIRKIGSDRFLDCQGTNRFGWCHP